MKYTEAKKRVKHLRFYGFHREKVSGRDLYIKFLYFDDKGRPLVDPVTSGGNPNAIYKAVIRMETKTVFAEPSTRKLQAGIEAETLFLHQRLKEIIKERSE